MSVSKYFGLAVVTAALSLSTALGAVEEGFTSLFNGKDLTGWQLVGKHGPGYLVEDGVIVCPANGGGNLFTEKEYSNFILVLK